MKQQQELRYLSLLAKQYPTLRAASTEMINLQSILNLPKGTEHFLSDIHGEHEAFLHIQNSASGVVREKIDFLFDTEMTLTQRDILSTLISYPEEKLEEIVKTTENLSEWYRITLHRLIKLCRLVGSKYTRSKVRKALPADYGYIIDELIHVGSVDSDKHDYFENIISTIIAIDQANAFVIAVCNTIKRMSVDHLHILGDIYDRGPGADIIMDSLMKHHSVDFQWGNHDILWMGAAAGSRTLVATVLANSIHYNNLIGIESGYGISLRPLALLAKEVYQTCDTHRFKVKYLQTSENEISKKDKELAAQMHKAITIILFKLEGQKILRCTEFNMGHRLLLDKINYENKTITIGDKVYALEDTDFPTVDPENPYVLTEEEESVINRLTDYFRRSEKLQAHVRLLYTKGSLYKIFNGNLLFHGCVPLNEDGSFTEFSIGCKNLSGRAFFDHAQTLARRAYYAKPGTPERRFGLDFLWYLWTGTNSPLFGRTQMTTFERRLILDETAWVEEKNHYYTHYNDREMCERILKEFGLEGPNCHIINGHMPVRSSRGESPVKGGGRLIVIDGGLSKAYQPTTGIAGYTLIFNSHCLRLVSHEAFQGKKQTIAKNSDMGSSSEIIEHVAKRLKIQDTDVGARLISQVNDLTALIKAYQSGAISERSV
ncbi:MAG: fructose-1,6-bisphosphatase [Eubacteriales bacterium]